MSNGEERTRARALGIAPGVLPPGRWNSITDVPGVQVGQLTKVEGKTVRTGVTAILPHEGNLLADRVPAGLSVANGHGKLAGATQIEELGEIETPIVLTNTLAVPRAADAILDWTLAQQGNESAISINPVVGETNDGWLSAIEERPLSVENVTTAIETATTGPIEEGCVGAGTGTSAMGWKAGIGTSARLLPRELEGCTLGVLVQSNFPGSLLVLGHPIGKILDIDSLATSRRDAEPPGSIMIILATDAPLSDRNLARLARRAFAGLARTGASFSNGSGDYAIAFSTAEPVRRTAARRKGIGRVDQIANEASSILFQAAIEATEEAIYNSLFMAETMTGRNGRTVEAVPLDRIAALLASNTADG